MVRAVHHENETLGTRVVMAPEGTDLVLAADVPDVELDVSEGDRLDVEADRGNGGDMVLQLELVQDGGLAGGVETEHEHTDFFGAEELGHEAERHDVAHFGGSLERLCMCVGVVVVVVGGSEFDRSGVV